MTVIDEAKKALEGVTPGPWHVGRGDGVPFVAGGGFARADILGPEKDRMPNARFIAWAREGVPALLAEIAAKDAEIARMRGEFIEATDENFIWGAMDNVHDAETTMADYAAAVSRAQRAAIRARKGGEG